ncbi:Phage protein [Brachybacterium faecium]|nr:Phage protein [Brachybacterium faecium]
MNKMSKIFKLSMVVLFAVLLTACSTPSQVNKQNIEESEEKEASIYESESIEESKESAEYEAITASQAAEEAESIEEEENKALSDKNNYSTSITYENLARTPTKYEGEKVKLSGKIIQVIKGEYVSQYRLAVDEDYDKMVLVSIDASQLSETRILEDDLITIYATYLGEETYESTMGGEITIPSLIAHIFTIN